jgi:hypothetical protein
MTISEGLSVALGIRHAMRVHRIAICGLTYSIIFSTSSHKICDFLKEIFEHKMCVFFNLSTVLFGTFTTLIRTERDTFINLHLSTCKVPVVLV